MPPAPGLILVVEDEPSLRDPLEHLLRLRHFDVISADTAEDALQAVRTHRPDAAIVDLHLKHGSGRDVIVRMPEKTPVVIFTGTVADSGHPAAHAAGREALLPDVADQHARRDARRR
jgi:DNA-binding response OmpR family regulator